MIQQSMSLTYEPSSEPLHMSATPNPKLQTPKQYVNFSILACVFLTSKALYNIAFEVALSHLSLSLSLSLPLSPTHTHTHISIRRRVLD